VLIELRLHPVELLAQLGDDGDCEATGDDQEDEKDDRGGARQPERENRMPPLCTTRAVEHRRRV
jgi:hypothetical protein